MDYQYDYFLQNYWITEPFFPGYMKNSSGPCLCRICFRMERLLTNLAFLPWEHEEFIRTLPLWHLLQDGDYWHIEPFFPGNMKNSSGSCLCGIFFRTEITDLPSLSSLGTWWFHRALSLASASRRRLLTYRAFLPWEHEEFIRAWSLWHLLLTYQAFLESSSLGTWTIHQGLVSVASSSGWRLLLYQAFLSWEHEEFIRALSLWHLLQDGDYWLPEPFFPRNMNNLSGSCLCGMCFWEGDYRLTKPFFPGNMKNSSRPGLCGICFRTDITDLLSLSSLGTWRTHQVLSQWHLLQDGEITD